MKTKFKATVKLVGKDRQFLLGGVKAVTSYHDSQKAAEDWIAGTIENNCLKPNNFAAKVQPVTSW